MAAVAAVVLRRRRTGPSKSTGGARKQQAVSNRVQYTALVEADRLRFLLVLCCDGPMLLYAHGAASFVQGQGLTRFFAGP